MPNARLSSNAARCGSRRPLPAEPSRPQAEIGASEARPECGHAYDRRRALPACQGMGQQHHRAAEAEAVTRHGHRRSHRGMFAGSGNPSNRDADEELADPMSGGILLTADFAR
jgi:hypothetical protein